MSASSKKKLRKEQQTAQLTEKQLQEKKEAKKLKLITVSFITGLCAVLCVALVLMGITLYNNSGIRERKAEAITIGDHTLSAAQFNFHYVDAVRGQMNEWYEQYSGSYADLMIQINERLDYSTPLNMQEHPDDPDRTYADFFSDKAVEQATAAYALYDAAVKSGFELTEEERKSIEDTIDSVDSVSDMYGKGANESLFREYLEVTALASSYEQKHLNSLEYTQEEVDAYSKEHFNDFSSFTYNTLTITASNMMDHSEDEEHVHTEEEDAEALKKAEAAADALVASEAADLDALNAAIGKQTELVKASKTASQTKNILYTNITEEAIAEWLGSADRTPGELAKIPYTVTTTDENGDEVTETTGYYVIQFVSRNDNNDKMVNVRHILTQFEGGSTDDSGNLTYSDAEKKVAEDAINAIKAQFEATAKTEEDFIALVADNSDDTASIADGGLYKDVFPGQMVENFDAWCFTEGRKAGDYGVVDTEYGYHLIYFSSVCEESYREALIRIKLRNEAHQEWYDALVEPVTVSELDATLVSTDLILGG